MIEVKKRSLILKLILKEKSLFLLGVFISVLILAVKLIQIVTTKQLINLSMEGELKIQFGIFFMSLILINALLAAANEVVVKKFGNRASKSVKLMLVNKLVNANYIEIENYSSGSFVSVVNNDCKAIEEFLSSSFFSLPVQILTAISAFIYMVTINWKLAIITFVYTPFGMFFANQVIKRVRELHPEEAKIKGEVLRNIEQSIKNLSIIKSYNMNERLSNQSKQVFNALYKTKMKIRFWDTLMQPACIALANLPVVMFSIFGGMATLNRQIDLGTFIATLSLIQFIIPLTVMLPFILTGYNKSLAACGRINEILSVSNKDLAKHHTKINNSTFVKIDNVDFSRGETKVLKDISFEIKDVGIHAIVGSSGAGKSTLLNVLSSLYFPDSGTVTISQQGWKEDLKQYSSNISYMPQDIHIYSDSFKNNVQLVNQYGDDSGLRSRIKEYSLNDFIEKMVAISMLN